MSAKLFLILEDGKKIELRQTDSVGTLIRRIQHREVETIVAGDVADGTVVWEKQFKACTVMPAEYGKARGKTI